MQEPLIDIQEVARRLGKSTKTVRRRVQAGVIPAIQEGGPRTQLRFDWQRVIQAITKGDPKNEQSKSEQPIAERLSGPRPKWYRRSKCKNKGDDI